MNAVSTVVLTHNKVELALHTLRAADGPNLLLLHGLGEASPTTVPRWAGCWTGAVHALDFTGHGSSTVPVGGGYTAEMLMADADMAIAHLGSATIVGRGLGAYIGLLIGGARADQVGGVVLADGPGISGGATTPTSQPVVTADAVDSTPDPYAIIELGRDLRPPDYATTFVRLANEGSDLPEPITVTAKFRPRWLRAVVDEPGVREAPSIADALSRYA
ncbi:MAG: alpha/beta hydrolase [Ilumatobacter sp.]|nr:alpha/beta hydrolase [Ilumatobacter sp.]